MVVSTEEPTDPNVVVWINPEEEAEEPSGGASIDVVAEVGQTIRVTEVDANGKPTKWESADYQPRTHWAEGGMQTILPETEIVMDETEEVPVIQTPFTLEAEHTYTIVYRGVSYECVAVDGAVIDNAGAILCGDVDGLLGGESNGVPFLLINSTVNQPCPSMLFAEYVEGDTMAIYENTEIVHKIDEKFLPDNPVVYITMDDQTGAFSHTYEEIMALFSNNKIVKLVLYGNAYTCNPCDSRDGLVFGSFIYGDDELLYHRIEVDANMNPVGVQMRIVNTTVLE